MITQPYPFSLSLKFIHIIKKHQSCVWHLHKKLYTASSVPPLASTTEIQFLLTIQSNHKSPESLTQTSFNYQVIGL
jgi:hypothetical protein